MRLHNQQLTRTTLTTPAEMVGWLGAAQAQDFTGAKWALGLRLRPTTDAAIDQAFNEGLILRTHIMRPTWHFVTPANIRWMLALTSPRVHVANGTMYRQLELDSDTLARGATIMARALRGGNALTRNEIRTVLEEDGVQVAGGRDRSGQRLAYLVMWAELEGLICSGPRRGKQFTYMLLDERVPQQNRTLGRDEALVELLRRYLTSHGPATAADFARWSGLTLADTRQGLGAIEREFHTETIAEQMYWFGNDAPPPAEPSPTAWLLSIYDEYTIGYKDWSTLGDEALGARLQALGNALQNVIIIDGQIVGTWRRVITPTTLTAELRPFAPLSEADSVAVARAAGQYGEFLGLPAVLR